MQAVFRNWENDADERLDTPSPDVFGMNGRTWYRVSIPFAAHLEGEALIDTAQEAKYQLDVAEANAIRRDARRYHYQAFE